MAENKVENSMVQPLLTVILHGAEDSAPTVFSADLLAAQQVPTLQVLKVADIAQGLAEASGRYIAFLQAGDSYEPGALRARLAYLEGHPEATLVHGDTRLVDEHGANLGAAITRRKAMSFEAAMHPVHLNSVMGRTELLQAIPYPNLPHNADWLFFAQVLRSGAVSQYVADGAAIHVMRDAPTLQDELAGHDDAMRDVIDWLYADVSEIYVADRYRQGLARPVRAVSRRLREFSLFVWGLVGNHPQACRPLLESEGFVGYLNTYITDSLVEEIQLQCARQYRVNLRERPQTLDDRIKTEILLNADRMGIAALAPSFYFALEDCFGRLQDPVKARDSGTPISVNAKFPLLTIPQAGAKGLAIITSFFTNVRPDAAQDCLQALLENCANPLVRTVHVLLEGDPAALDVYLGEAQKRFLQEALEQGRLVYVPIAARPNYKQLFDHANSLAPGVVAVINADIVVPPEAARSILEGRQCGAGSMYCLTRWNRAPGGSFLSSVKSSSPWPEWSLEERSWLDRDTASYDCYVVDAPSPVPQSLEGIYIGTMGCDLAIAACYRVLGVEVDNPCLDIKSIHVDTKPYRDYLGEKAARDMAAFMHAVETELLKAIPVTSPGYSALRDAGALSSQVAWLGGPGDFNVKETVAKILGHVLWAKEGENRLLPLVKLSITNGSLDDAVEAVLAHEQAILDKKIFIAWELSGFSHDGHIGDMMLGHPRLEALGYVLFRYKWQTMVHLDRASAQAKRVLEDLAALTRNFSGATEDVSCPVI